MNTIDAKERAAGLRQIAHHLHPTEREELEEAAQFLDVYEQLVQSLRAAWKNYDYHENTPKEDVDLILNTLKLVTGEEES
jgi:hypothetical protein